MTPRLRLRQLLLLWVTMAVLNDGAVYGSNTGPIRLQLTVSETDGDLAAPPSSAHLPINLDNLPKRLTDLGQLPDWPRIVYSLLTVQPQLAARSLSLDRSTGLLRLVSPLRREYLCPSSIAALNCSQTDPADSCRISAAVRIQNLDSEADFLIAELLIDVLDVDNTPPQFERTVLPDEEIWENIPVGHVIPLPRAVDADRSGYATCRLVYSLVRCSPEDPPPDRTFSLSRGSSFNTVGPPEYKLRLDRELDRESVSRYRYCIAASSDQDQRGRTATVTLVIRVRDHNDNAPVWSPGQLFSVNVSEVNPPGLLLKMSATDADSEFGQVHYRLLRDDSLFAINSLGEITLRHTNGLDYETARQHLLVVAAIDNGKPALSVTATVTINVLDANDNRPRINLEHQFKSVVENNPVPLYIHTLDVSDRDPGANGALSCQVGPIDLIGVFYLELKLNSTANTIYTLYANRSFDRETISQYTVVIECRDNGSPPLSSAATVNIRITDENDNPPAFPVSPIDISFLESVSRDSKVYDLRVVDPDLDRHDLQKQREFQLTGDGADHFRVVYQGGYGGGGGGSFQYALTTTKEFDRETRDSYRFNITVIDWIDKPPVSAGSDQPTATPPPRYHQAVVEVSVRILDVNDCPPVFNHTGPRTFEVYENASLGSVIGTVFATDRDLGENGRVLYSLAPQPQLPYFHAQHQQQLLQAVQRLFRVDANNGEISLGGRLDLEGPSGLSQHSLEILARDLGKPSLSSTASIVVKVLDCNDNRPLFRSTAPLGINVSCDESVENHILPLSASELDVVDADISEAFKQRRYRLAGVTVLTQQHQMYTSQAQLLQQQPQQWHSFAVDENTGQVFVKSAPKLCQFSRYKLNLEVFEPSHPREVSRKSIVVTFEGGGRQPGGARPSGQQQPGSQQPPAVPGQSGGKPRDSPDDGRRGGGRGLNGNLVLRSSDTEGIVIAALVVASLILAAVLILAVVLLRKRLRKDATAAAAAAAAAVANADSSTAGASTFMGGGTYVKGGRILLVPKASVSTAQLNYQTQPRVRRDSNESVNSMAEAGDDNRVGGGFVPKNSCPMSARRDLKISGGVLTSPSMDSVLLGAGQQQQQQQLGRQTVLGGMGRNRYGKYGNASVAAEQMQTQVGNSLLETDLECRMPLKGNCYGSEDSGVATSRRPVQHQQQQQQQKQQQHTYQTVLPPSSQQQASAEVQNTYMTFRYPAGEAGPPAHRKIMIDSKRRPSQSSTAAGGDGKSPYFTVSFV